MKYLIIILFLFFILSCSTQEKTIYNRYEIFNSNGQVCVHRIADTTSTFKCFTTLNEAINFIDYENK